MKTKILTTEHDRIDNELIHNELQKCQIEYAYIVVDNENDYLHAFESFNPDIILCDYTFPSFDGPSAFKIKEALAPNTPFIFVSGAIGEEHSIELIKRGVTDFCLKDKLTSLSQKVIRALNESNASLQKRHLEEELRQSEKRLNRAQQGAHMGNWDLNFATNDLRWSEEVFRIYGLLPHRNKQSLESALSFIHPEDVEFVTKKVKDSQNTLSDFSITYRIVQKNGSIRHVHAESKLELDSEGKAIGSFGTAHDVTEKMLHEITLAQERLTKQIDITDAMLTALENERAEIGIELHDNLTQVLGVTKLYIELAITDEENRDMCLAKACRSIMSVTDRIKKSPKS